MENACPSRRLTGWRPCRCRCRVYLENVIVSIVKVGWLRADDQTILSLHRRVVTHNPRVSVTHDESRTWNLHIRQIKESDQGCYMCQVLILYLLVPWQNNQTLISVYKTPNRSTRPPWRNNWAAFKSKCLPISSTNGAPATWQSTKAITWHWRARPPANRRLKSFGVEKTDRKSSWPLLHPVLGRTTTVKSWRRRCGQWSSRKRPARPKRWNGRRSWLCPTSSSLAHANDSKVFLLVAFDDKRRWNCPSWKTEVDAFNGETLRLYRVTRQMMAAYMCIASNEVPPAVSKRVPLNVNCKLRHSFIPLSFHNC